MHCARVVRGFSFAYRTAQRRAVGIDLPGPPGLVLKLQCASTIPAHLGGRCKAAWAGDRYAGLSVGWLHGGT